MPKKATTSTLTKNGRKRERGRRVRGEGTIFFHEASGQWAAQLSAGSNPDGSRRRPTVYGATEAEVLDKRDRLRAQLRLGRLADAQAEGQVKTLGEWLDEWLPLKADLRERARKVHENAVRLHLKPSLGTLPLAQIRPSDVKRLLLSLKAKRLAPRSIKLYLGTLRMALDQAEEDRLIDQNPARSRSVRAPRAAKPVHRPLESEHVAAFFAVAARAVVRRRPNRKGQPERVVEPDRLYALWLLAVYHGLREGELLGLQWADVAWKRDELAVRRELVRVEPKTHEPVYDDPKSEAGRRTIGLSESVLVALRAHQRRQAAERDAAAEAGLDYATHTLIFATELGRPLLARNVVRRFKRLLALAGLDAAIRVHDTRHTAGSVMATDGIDAATIAEILGHSDPAFTARTYIHPLREARAKAAASAERLFGRRSSPGEAAADPASG